MNPRRALFEALLAHWGTQHWWPADSPFEVMLGAVLTQNTAWTNVEKAIANLRRVDALQAQTIASMPVDELAELLRPAGYFNVKARRLQSYCRWFAAQGGLEALQLLPTDALRGALLGVHGVGRETADDILLYALYRPVFVIDAYTRRLCSRLGISQETDYERLRAEFERELSADVPLFQEFHALIVIHAKEVCRSRPRCTECCLRERCAFAVAA